MSPQARTLSSKGHHSCVQNAKPPTRAKDTIFLTERNTLQQIPQQRCFCPDTEETTGQEASAGSRQRLESWKEDELVGAEALCLLEDTTGHCTDAQRSHCSLYRCPAGASLGVKSAIRTAVGRQCAKGQGQEYEWGLKCNMPFPLKSYVFMYLFVWLCPVFMQHVDGTWAPA